MTLKHWRNANRYSLGHFHQVRLKEVGNLDVTTRTLMNREKGHSLRSLEKAEAVRKATGGKVTPFSFVKGSSRSSLITHTPDGFLPPECKRTLLEGPSPPKGKLSTGRCC